MSRYRMQRDAMSELAGRRARQIRGMLSRREAEDFDGQRATAVGREAADGTFEADDMDVFGAAGVVARPAENETIEAVAAFVGGDGDHPVTVSVLDHGRAAVIDAVGLDADETILYTSQAVVKILADGTVEIRKLGGVAVRLATLGDVQALRDYVATHTHPVPGVTTGPGATTASAPATPPSQPAGTTVLKAQ